MDWKNFLKPNWKKILLSAVLILMVHMSFFLIIMRVTGESSFERIKEEGLIDVLAAFFLFPFGFISISFLYVISCWFIHSLESVIRKAGRVEKRVLLAPSIFICLIFLFFIYFVVGQAAIRLCSKMILDLAGRIFLNNQ